MNEMSVVPHLDRNNVGRTTSTAYQIVAQIPELPLTLPMFCMTI